MNKLFFLLTILLVVPFVVSEPTIIKSGGDISLVGIPYQTCVIGTADYFSSLYDWSCDLDDNGLDVQYEVKPGYASEVTTPQLNVIQAIVGTVPGRVFATDFLEWKNNGLPFNQEVKPGKAMGSNNFSGDIQFNNSKRFKVGFDSVDINIEDGLVDISVTPETIVADSFDYHKQKWKYFHPITVTNSIDSNSNIILGPGNFAAVGIDFELVYDYVYVSTESSRAENPIFITNPNYELCYNDANGFFVGDSDCVYIQVANTHSESTTYLRNFDLDITVSPGTTQKIYYKYYYEDEEIESTKKWDFYFFYPGSPGQPTQGWLIDPLFVVSTDASDLNHDFDFNGFVNQRPLDGEWVATAELDWNLDANFPNDYDVNLIGYYQLNESSGTTLFDETVNGNNVDLDNGAFLATGMWDTNGVSVDGANDRIDFVNVLGDLDIDNTTFSAWVRRDFDDGPGDSAVFGVRRNNNNQVTLQFDGGATVWRFRHTGGGTDTDIDLAPDLIPQGIWTKIDVSWDFPNDEMQFFVNGELEGTASGLGAFSGVPSTFFVGANGSGGANFEGRVEEIKVFDKNITSSYASIDFNNWHNAVFVNANPIDGSQVADWNKVGINILESFNDWNTELVSLDINIFTCSDSGCVTKTSSLFIPDMNSGQLLDINGLLAPAQFISFELFFNYDGNIFDFNGGHLSSVRLDNNIAGAPIEITFISPICQFASQNTQFFSVGISSTAGIITDVNYTVNGGPPRENLTNKCNGIGSADVNCFFLDDQIIPFQDNNIDFTATVLGSDVTETCTYFFNPTKIAKPIFIEDTSLDYLSLFIVGSLLILGALFIRRRNNRLSGEEFE